MTALDDAVLNWKFVNALGGQRAHDELNKLHAMELENERLQKAVEEAEKVIYHVTLCDENDVEFQGEKLYKWLKEYGKAE